MLLGVDDLAAARVAASGGAPSPVQAEGPVSWNTFTDPAANRLALVHLDEG